MISGVSGKHYYEPSDRGYEDAVRKRLAQWWGDGRGKTAGGGGGSVAATDGGNGKAADGDKNEGESSGP